ncbi:MAG: helix-turn-helix transcriptional regulator [Lachnospiraceae bacterium]|nr:helix-turn-helix transcriptional regulator [Lachnospiraceae bacterium]
MNYTDIFTAVDPSQWANDAKFEKEFTAVPHSAYEWERAYMSFVRAGDVQGARQYMEQLAESGVAVQVGNLSSDDLIQNKFLAVSMMAVITRVAIRNGADELTAYQISDAYLQYLAKAKNVDEFSVKLFQAVEALIQLVHDAKEAAEHNAYYLRCREYIGKNLGQKITVSDLAELCGLTPNYLSYVFKKASGKTVTEYILDQRIQLAKQLLLREEHTSAEIAFFLGFTSQSYFISCFKKTEGMTPRAWKLRQTKGAGVELYPE